MTALRRSFLLVGPMLCAALAVGCAGDSTSGEIFGTVTIDGKTPPLGSSISFSSADGKSPTSGSAIVDGKYSAKVPVGKVKVEIRAPRVLGKSSTQKGPGAGRDVVEESVPSKYNDETTLSFDVKPGRNEKAWDLKTTD